MQVKLLRLLETGTYRRVGSTELIRADIRLISATHRPLKTLVETGQFRQDLFYRVNAFPIVLPPLRSRRDDIPLLAEGFLREFTALHQRAPQEISREAMRLMRLYSWPGNIRQLRNLMERLVITVTHPAILPEHLPEEIQASTDEARRMVVTLGTSLKEIEKETIRRTLAEVVNHREKAAKLLGISLRALQYKIKQYGIRE